MSHSEIDPSGYNPHDDYYLPLEQQSRPRKQWRHGERDDSKQERERVH